MGTGGTIVAENREKTMKSAKSKSAHIAIRVADDTKARMDTVAEAFGLGTSTLARVLLDRFCSSYEEHGDQLIWPPQFNYHLSPATYLDAIHGSDKERLRLVAEAAEEYNAGNPNKKT